MKKRLRILFLGPLYIGGTCLMRFQAMKDLGYEVVPVNTEPEEIRRLQKRLFYRIKRKLLGPQDLAGVNQKIIKIVEESHFDVVWVDKGIMIKPETLLKIKSIQPQMILVHYNPDDPFGRFRSGWSTFIKSIPFYDIHFVSRRVNVAEYKRVGARKVVFLLPFRGFSPSVHRPVQLNEKEKYLLGGPVGFIGSYEKERAEYLLYLAEKGVPVRVWGSGWAGKRWLKHPNLRIEGKELIGEDYVKGICSFDIVLCFLRKGNRDLHTSRSIEIPACGAFMLAERTDEHKQLFEEGKEAEFFNTKEEMLEKMRYYLEHEDERLKIAAAGRQRCLRSRYSYQERLREMLRIALDLG